MPILRQKQKKKKEGKVKMVKNSVPATCSFEGSREIIDHADGKAFRPKDCAGIVWVGNRLVKRQAVLDSSKSYWIREIGQAIRFTVDRRPLSDGGVRLCCELNPRGGVIVDGNLFLQCFEEVSAATN